MSLRAIVWALSQKTGNSTTKFVLVKLADNANDSGLAWPSMKTIADAVEIDRSTAIRHIKKLVELRLVEVVHRSHEGINLSNHYRLLMVEGGSGTALPPVAENDRGSRAVPLGVVAQRHPNHPIEPPNEPTPPPQVDEQQPATMEEVAVEFPPNLDPQIHPALLAQLRKVAPGDKQSLIDDLAGWVATKAVAGCPVRNPAAAFRPIALRYFAGEWLGESAHIGAALRERHRKSQLPPPSATKPAMDAEALVAGEKFLKTLRDRRKGENHAAG